MAIHDRVEGWIFEESPCELCPFAGRCRVELLACDAFVSFAAHGGRRWRSQRREPDAATYRRVFGGEAAELAA